MTGRERQSQRAEDAGHDEGPPTDAPLGRPGLRGRGDQNPLTRDPLILTVVAAAEAQAQMLLVKLRGKMVRSAAVNRRPLYVYNTVRKDVPDLCRIE